MPEHVLKKYIEQARNISAQLANNAISVEQYNALKSSVLEKVINIDPSYVAIVANRFVV